MFKSIFSKYVTTFMAIILFGFSILLLIITSISASYSVQAKKELLTNTAQTLQVYLEEKVTGKTPDAFPTLIEEIEEGQLAPLLESFSALQTDLDLILADQSGKLCYTFPTEVESGTVVLPDIIVEIVSADGSVLEELSFGATERAVETHAVGITNETGELCGILVLCANEKGHRSAVEDLSQSVVTSAVLVLLASLIAAYFLTERTIAPLREMRNAARGFASGNFESRVRVRGRDEVAELSEAFNQMADSLENLEKMRNSFVANVSHDLRTPMTTIAGFIDGIRDGVIPPEEHDHYLGVVSMEVHRLSRLVASLLDLSRIQAGDRKFVMKSFDICEMARLILISFEQNIEEKSLQVSFDCDEDRMSVWADRDAIYQIFYNICHNAVKFSCRGGELRIRISVQKDKKILVSIYNEGEGISEEDLPMVFERFYKSDKSRGLDKTGVGLGLYIAKTIISAHGERIGVSSERGKYCEFYFTLQRSSGRD